MFSLWKRILTFFIAITWSTRPPEMIANWFDSAIHNKRWLFLSRFRQMFIQAFTDMPYIRLMINTFVIFSHTLLIWTWWSVVIWENLYFIVLHFNQRLFKSILLHSVRVTRLGAVGHYKSCNIIRWLVKKWICKIFSVMSGTITSCITN